MADHKNTLPKIICIDDEPSVLSAIERVLRKDFQVLTGETGLEGLSLLRSHSDCAVILSDFKMPELNGLEFLTQARALAPLAVRCILSGHIDLPQLSKAINGAEIHRFLLKPWDNEYLRLQMSEALQFHSILVEKQALKSLAITDPVTHLTNHRYFQENLDRLINRTGQDLSLVMVDVDHFKSFNDHYGHPEGDRLLTLIADRLKQSVPNGSNVSRYGGEEFVLTLSDMPHTKATELAENIRSNFENHPFSGPHGRPAYVTISLGVASLNERTNNKEKLITSADQALYQAKRQGRNRCVSCRPN